MIPAPPSVSRLEQRAMQLVEAPLPEGGTLPLGQVYLSLPRSLEGLVACCLMGTPDDTYRGEGLLMGCEWYGWCLIDKI